MHRAFLVVHRYLALAASLVLVVVALSGSAVTFEDAIDRALNPRLWRVAGAGVPVPLDTLAARARAVHPGAIVTGVGPSTEPGRAAVVSLRDGRQVFENPYTGAVLGSRTVAARERGLARRLHVLHVSLMAGRAGTAIVSLVTVLALVLVVTGVVLWWPEKIWRVRLRGSWKRVNFDLHHLLGIASSVVLFLMTASGVVLGFAPLGRLIGRLDRAPSARRPVQPPAAPGATTISLDIAAAVARATLQGAVLTGLQVPSDPRFPVVAAMRFPEEHTAGGRSRVYIDRYRGSVLLADNARRAPIGRRINSLQRSLHTGDVLGTPTAALWSVASLVLAGQAVTGVLMWWNARAARRAAARSANGAA